MTVLPRPTVSPHSHCCPISIEALRSLRAFEKCCLTPAGGSRRAAGAGSRRLQQAGGSQGTQLLTGSMELCVALHGSRSKFLAPGCVATPAPHLQTRNSSVDCHLDRAFHNGRAARGCDSSVDRQLAALNLAHRRRVFSVPTTWRQDTSPGEGVVSVRSAHQPLTGAVTQCATNRSVGVGGGESTAAITGV
jgi:hypothetical protein